MRGDVAGRVFLAVLLAAVAALAVVRIAQYDFWYHLRVGQLILDSGFLGKDPFSFTATTEPASTQSWLAGVIFALAHRVGGVAGVQLLNAAMVAATFGLVFAATRLFAKGSSDLWLSGVLILLAALACRFRLSVRPHVLEFLLLAADLYVLQRYRVRGRAPLWVLPILQVVWVNVHGSHVLGVALPLLFLFATSVEGAVHARLGATATAEQGASGKRAALALLGTSAACVAATLVNPLGWRALLFPFQVVGLGTYMEQIGEWSPMTAEFLFGYGFRYTWAFSALAIVGVVSLVVSWRRPRIADGILFVVFLVAAARGIRLIVEFVIVAVPGIFAGLSPLAARAARGRERQVTWAAAALVALAVPIANLDSRYQVGFGEKTGIFPDKAISFVERNGITGRVFNSFAFGDYLVFRAPQIPVYIHGRNEVFPEAFYQEFLDAHGDPAIFQRVVERWNIEWLLLEYGTDYARKEAIPHLLKDPRWVPVYWDAVAVVWVRRDGVNGEVASRLGLDVVRPTRFEFSYLDDVLRRRPRQEVLAEFERLLERAPDNEEAYLAAAYVLFTTGAIREAKGPLERARALNGARAMTHSGLGIIALREGDRAAARADFERALELDPNDPGAIDGMRAFGIQVARAVPSGHP